MKKYGPDSKQSWQIVVAVSVIKFMLYGPLEMAGMLMVYTMHRFDTTREAASLPYTLVYTIRNGSGPIIAYIGNIIGLRKTTLIGCILSSTAIGACFFAESVMTVTILWGIIFGFGFALEGLFLNSILMEHFKMDLSKAVGISNAGAVFGVCCFTPYLDFLVNTLGLSGAFLLFGGAAMHAVPAAFFILLNKPFKRAKLNESKAINVSEVGDKVTEKTITSDCNDSNSITVQSGFITQQSAEWDQTGCTNTIHSREAYNNTELQVRTISYKVSCTETFEIANRPNSDQRNDVPISSNKHKCAQNGSDCEESASTCNKNNSVVNRLRNSTRTDNGSGKLQSHKVMKTLFSHPIFWLILICNGMYYFTLPAFLTLLVDYCIDNGIDPANSKYIVIYSTVVEFFGCLVIGWLEDLKIVSSNAFVIILFLCQSLTLICMPWVRNIIILALLVLAFQWAQTGVTLIYPAVVSDSLEKEIQASALASMFILAAPLDLAISPLIGYFRDERGSYTGVYLTLALAAFIGGVSQMCILKSVNRKKQPTKT